MSQNRKTAKVSALVHYLKQKLESDGILHGILVEGEMSNLRRPYTGHWYFSLKDEKAQINAVMFASANRKLKFEPKNGDKVIVRADVSVYEAGGAMQLIVSDMSPYGIGDLYRQLEILKEKLLKEGLFAAEHKKPLPPYPMNVALVTGNNTAAKEDVLITIRKRWPAAEVHEYPCPVQGSDAPPKIIEALDQADQGGHDVILLVRGGGSIEDLWCFNDEMLARKIYAINTPIVTGIGHEIDFTLADYTADVRANTPTGAVEAAMPDQAEVLASLRESRKRISYVIQTRLKNEQTLLQRHRSTAVFQHPERMWTEQAMMLDHYMMRLMQYPERISLQRQTLNSEKQEFHRHMIQRFRQITEQLKDSQNYLTAAVSTRLREETFLAGQRRSGLETGITSALGTERKNMEKQAALLDAYSPLKILSRGYSVVSSGEHVITSAEEVQKGDLLQIRLYQGSVEASVINTETENGKERNEI